MDVSSSVEGPLQKLRVERVNIYANNKHSDYTLDPSQSNLSFRWILHIQLSLKCPNCPECTYISGLTIFILTFEGLEPFVVKN